MKISLPKQWFVLGVILITILAIGLRFYQFAQVPHGMTWDEAAIGWSGYGVWTTRRDEWLIKLPISFRSFGDYKSPFAIYLNGFFTVLFGMQLWVVRLPFAVGGVVAVIGMILLVRQLFDRFHYPYARQFGLIAGALLTISPWHLQFTRSGFESGLATCFLIVAVWTFLKWLHQSDEDKLTTINTFSWKNEIWLGLASISSVLSLYTYHSAKFVTPVVFLYLAIIGRKTLWRQRLPLFITSLISFLLLLPLLADSIFAKGSERLGQATLFGLKLSTPELIQHLATNTVAHFDPNFLLHGATTTLRHSDGQWGIFLPASFFLLCCGFVSLIASLFRKHQSEIDQIGWFGLTWYLIGLVPAIIGRDVPHANRALLALPGAVLLLMYGLDRLLAWLKQTKLNQWWHGSRGEQHLLVKSVIGCLILIESFCSLAYLHHYYTSYAADSASDFQDGYLEAARYAREVEPQVERVLFTSTYGQPYIYLLFVGRISPIAYRNGVLVKYQFPDHITPGDLSRSNTLIVATPEELDPKLGQKLIYGSDGKVRFVIVRTP